MRNVVDSIVEYVSPVAAAKRLAARRAISVLNTGYSEGGASSRKSAYKGWIWRGGSTREDIDRNLGTLQQRSRDLFMNSGVARAAIGRYGTNVIGPGLRLRALPDADVLGISNEQAKAWATRVQREFALWASSHECDSQGLNDFYELQLLTFISWLMSGDVFGLLQLSEPERQPYELRIHLLEADRICNPAGKDKDPLFRNGVEIDASGRVVAYHVRSNHPLTQGLGAAAPTWTRVPVWGEESGRLNILHLMIAERPEQYRGVPILAPVIEQCKQITRYSEAELMGAVVSALLTVFVKTETPQTPLGEALPDEEKVTPADSPAADFNYELGPGAIIGLNPGEDIQTVNPSRPNAQFDAFVNATATQIGAALDVPAELLLLRFTASYSASRAALLEAWKGFRMRRTWMANDFCSPVYREWLEEAILKGRIEAPGYFDDYVVQAAWSRANWHGPSPGQIDPLKEVNAAAERIDRGLSTHAREALEISGMDFDEIVQEQAVERQMLREAGIIQDPAAQVPPEAASAGNEV